MEEDYQEIIWNEYIKRISNGDYEGVRELMNQFAIDINTVDSKGRSLLHVAVSRNHIHIVRLLLENGIDTTLADVNKNTALHLATINGYSSIVSMILEYNSLTNVNVVIADKNNNSPFELAISRLKRSIESSKTNSISPSDRLNQISEMVYDLAQYIHQHLGPNHPYTIKIYSTIDRLKQLEQIKDTVDNKQVDEIQDLLSGLSF
ncbi:hypothetical protein CYY_006918 [Polysphondylium violaceum]|uniref:Ankyrin repeat-containing protein n=1 Tax=Polysphondylium violaceum TaxID=133409 RepID=A0A8J4PPI6_9MYCE|nr:hypothetical protein CYY_006918 [Polysphondylium violaceum]